MSKIVAQWTEGDKRYVLQEHPLEHDVVEGASANDNRGSSEEEPSDFWSWAPRGDDGEILPIPDADLPARWRWRPKEGKGDRTGIPELCFGLFIEVPGKQLVARSEELLKLKKTSDDDGSRPTYEIILDHALSRWRRETYMRPLVHPLARCHWAKIRGPKDPNMKLLLFYFNDDGYGTRRWFEGERMDKLLGAFREAFQLPDDAQPMWYVLC